MKLSRFVGLCLVLFASLSLMACKVDADRAVGAVADAYAAETMTDQRL